jgi:hypothetical protein
MSEKILGGSGAKRTPSTPPTPSEQFETLVIYPGRYGQRVGVARADDGSLLAVMLERPDGTWERLERVPRWLKLGIRHARCSARLARGEDPCWKCAPSIAAREAEARAVRRRRT